MRICDLPSDDDVHTGMRIRSYLYPEMIGIIVSRNGKLMVDWPHTASEEFVGRDCQCEIVPTAAEILIKEAR